MNTNGISRRGALERMGLLTLAAQAGSATDSNSKSHNLDYTDKSLPQIPAIRHDGEWYDTEVPDSLEIPQMAELAIHGITQMLDASRNYVMYSEVWFNRRPPAVVIEYPEQNLSCGPKHLESLALVRLINGSRSYIDVDQKFMQSMLNMTAPDGCFYMPRSMSTINPNCPPPFDEPFASVEGEGRNILALCMWYQHDRNPLWKTLIEKKIKRLSELAVPVGDYLYFNNRPYRNPIYGEVYFTLKDQGPIRDASGGEGRFGDPQSVHQVNFMLSRSLCVYYRLSGYEPALQLAGKIIRCARYHRKGFAEDGRWLLFHFHTSTASLLSMLDYAVITKDHDLLEYVRRAYEYGKMIGDPTIGFFPEVVPGSARYIARNINTCETCEIADMIGLALKLSHAGVGDYWDDADHWVRNQLFENQLKDVDWARDVNPDAFKYRPHANVGAKHIGSFEESFKYQPHGGLADKPIMPWETGDIQRAIGGFAGWSLPNDFGPGTMHMCCTGNASRTLYWIWDSILTRDGDKVRVNLLLNRASPWLDLDSYLPYEGKVSLKIKTAKEVAVRIPKWSDFRGVTCALNENRCQFSRSGNYVTVQDLKKGDVLTLHFPVPETTAYTVIGEFPYRIRMKGSTVVEVEPKGGICPLYQRSTYTKGTEAPVSKVRRFVSQEAPLW